MVKNRLLLGSVAFGVGFGLSLLVNRDIKPALLTGLIAVPATFTGVFAVNGKQRIQQKPTLTALKAQIYQLERWETELHQSISEIAAEKQRTEVNVNFLKTELSQLYAQIAEERSYKQQLSQDVVTLSAEREQLEAKLQDLQTQIDSGEKRREDLYQSVRSLRVEKQNTEASYKGMQAELHQLQLQITERQQQKQELEQNLAFSNDLQLQLGEDLHNLQEQIQALEQHTAELKQNLDAIAQEKQTTEVNLILLQAQLSQVQTQILEQQDNKHKLEQELITLINQKQKLATEIKHSEKLPNKWNEFVARLNEPELQVLKAIIQQDDPTVEIKKIAEENITMPELLIDAINECALDTIKDLIIEPGSELVPLGIIEEYLINVSQAIKIKEING